MKVFLKLILLFLLAGGFVGCSKKIIYEGPTPTKEMTTTLNDKNCG